MKVLFFDTESNSLTANWGRLLCSSFCELGGDAYTFRGDVPPWTGRNKIDDSKLAVAMRDEIEQADILCTWNGMLHDLPLLNARLAKAKQRACLIGEKYGTWHLDMMYYAGGQSLKVGGRRLETIATFFELEEQKTPLDGDVWQLASVGDKAAMSQIVVHCEQDVKVLRELWPKLAPLVMKFQFPLSSVWPYIDKIPSRRQR